MAKGECACMEKTGYIQAVSRIRVLETKLLDKARIDRLINSSSGNEAFKILQETEYGMLMSNLKRSEEYEVILSEELKRLYALMYEVSPEASVVDIMSIRYDYHNLKVLLKAKFLNINLDHLLVPVGIVNTEILKKCIWDNDYRDLNKYMREACEIIENAFKAQDDPQKIDIVVDSFMYKDMVSKSSNLDNKFVIDYIKINIDLINIKTMLRVKKQKKDREFLKEVLICGGKIDIDVFVNYLNDSVENFANKLSYTDYYNILKLGIEEYSKNGKLNLFEKLSDNFIMNYVKNSKYISFGPEPLMTFIFAKETEIKAIRIIMVGKLNNVSPEVIRERLRDIYV